MIGSPLSGELKGHLRDALSKFKAQSIESGPAEFISILAQALGSCIAEVPKYELAAIRLLAIRTMDAALLPRTDHDAFPQSAAERKTLPMAPHRARPKPVLKNPNIKADRREKLLRYLEERARFNERCPTYRQMSADLNMTIRVTQDVFHMLAVEGKIQTRHVYFERGVGMHQVVTICSNGSKTAEISTPDPRKAPPFKFSVERAVDIVRRFSGPIYKANIHNPEADDSLYLLNGTMISASEVQEMAENLSEGKATWLK